MEQRSALAQSNCHRQQVFSAQAYLIKTFPNKPHHKTVTTSLLSRTLLTLTEPIRYASTQATNTATPGFTPDNVSDGVHFLVKQVHVLASLQDVSSRYEQARLSQRVL